jgi:amino acid adenylation domain-containing protein
VTGSLPELLTSAALEHHDRTAVVADRTLTYGELDELASRIAAALIEAGVRPGDRVAVCAPKSAGVVASQYGVMRAGAAYVPIDHAAPDRRAIRIANDCAVAGLIAERARLDRLGPDLPPAAIGLDLDRLDTLPPAAPGRSAVSTDQDHLAYVLYTSGSTGSPKGVMLSHGNARSFVDWAVGELKLTAEDRFSSHAPFHFDLSVFDLYACASVGGTMHAVPDEVLRFGTSSAAFVRERELTVWYSVPSALVYLLLHGDLGARDLERLRLVLFAGEVFPMKYLRQLADVLPGAELYNLYGPTETNVCTYHRLDRWRLAGQERLPIGRPCGNTETLALDVDGRPVGPGETGELYVRGPSVTPGYWGDPDKTQRALVPNPVQPYLGDRLYRTGDLVTLDEHGEYLFLGRRDSQVKSRGYRIELGDVEAALYAHPAVVEAAVLAMPDEELGSRLRAVVALKSGERLTVGALQAHCASLVPRYMVPDRIELRPSLPKTSTGKTDRTRLAAELEA